MTNEQIDIAIAELLGWRFIENDPDYEPYWEDPNGTKIAVNFIYHRVPNCSGCLNAMHEAEQALWRMDWNKRYVFNDNLANIIKGKTVNRNEWNAETLLDSTARQRAEAFLRTLGKWEEEE